MDSNFNVLMYTSGNVFNLSILFIPVLLVLLSCISRYWNELLILVLKLVSLLLVIGSIMDRVRDHKIIWYSLKSYNVVSCCIIQLYSFKFYCIINLSYSMFLYIVNVVL